MTELSSRHQYQLAVVGILFSSSMWGLIWYPMRLFEAAGMPVVWVTLVMYLTAAILSLPYLLRQPLQLRQQPPELFALMLVAGVTNLAFLIALIEGEVMRVMLLFFLSPLWSMLIGRWWLGEHLSGRAMVLMALAMSGTVLMLWRPEMGFPWPHGLGDWLGLFAGICFSVNNVLSRKLARVPMQLKLTAVFWGVVLVAPVVLLFRQTSLPEVAVSVWLAAMLCGVVILAMTLSVLYGLARMPVYRSAVIMLFELIVAAVAAWWLAGELMSPREWLGGILIFIAAYGVALADKYAASRAQLPDQAS